ncbi:MAG: exo-alpha-sialidase [Armatimonadetes bacterium]|nr:exo-alpha-sialidase [Armatimonadota bacterium]
MDRVLACLVVVALHSVTFAQWEDVKKLGSGGETYVSTDGKGTVYVSSHIPVQAIVSRDWGATFGEPKVFDNSLGDMVVYARPNGKAVVTYMYPMSTAGMATWKVSDYGKNWEQGKGIPGRPLDREWPATDEKTGAVYLVYSDGYIGGPKSKGVFVSKSTDDGLSWSEMGRVDKEAPGDYPVDPHMVSTKGGKLYALWTTSKDYDKVDAYKVAYSTDGGKSWQGHTTLGTVDKIEGADVQERWMLGGLACYGEDEVCGFFMNYKQVVSQGRIMPCLLVFTRRSHDGGKTWGPASPVVSPEELKRAALAYNKKRVAEENYPSYMQCLSWAAFDAKGRLHMVWQDDRDGQGTLDGKAFDRWHVRTATAKSNSEEFGDSEQVSKTVTCLRPPLDFICCCADDKYLYVTWTETPQSSQGWNFTGEFWFGRKKLE